MKKQELWVLTIIDRKTKEIVQTETRKSEQAADRLWCKAISNVNPLKYKMKIEKLTGERNETNDVKR